MIPVVCQSCNSKINAPEKYAGKRVACPKCNAALTVPTGDSSPSSSNAHSSSVPPNLQGPDQITSEQQPHTNSYAESIEEDIPFAEYVEDAEYLGLQPAAYASDPAPKSHQVSSSEPQPKPTTNKILVPLLIVGGFTTILSITGLVLFAFYYANSSDGNSNSPPQIVADSAIVPDAAPKNESARPVNPPAPSGTALLKGDAAKPITPPAPLKWVDYYNNARSRGERAYVYLENTPQSKTWMLASKTNEERATLNHVENANDAAQQNFELLRYPPNSSAPLELPPVTTKFPNLVQSVYSDDDFKITRLATIGIWLRDASENKSPKNRTFVWSVDGNFLYVLQSVIFDNTQQVQRRVLKINSNTWVVEAAADFFAEDIAICSEGLVLTALNYQGRFVADGHPPVHSDRGVLFPLQNNFDTKYHLAVLDPETLKLKYSYPMPPISHLAGDPTSSRVFFTSFDSFLFEMDLRSNQLIRAAYSPGKFRNLVYSKNALYSHSMESQLTKFDTTKHELDEFTQLTDVGIWSTLSQNGNFVVARNPSDYFFYNSEDFVRPLASISGPAQGMACIDDETNAALIAGIDPESKLTARIIQGNVDWSIILANAKFFPNVEGVATNEQTLPSFSQLSENLAYGSQPTVWQRDRSPFFLSAIPQGKGFLLFTLEGAFHIKPTKKGSEISFDIRETRSIDITKELSDKTHLTPPTSPPSTLEMSFVQANPGSVFGLPKGFAISDSHVDSESGDVYLSASLANSTASSPMGNWVIRLPHSALNKSQSIPFAAARIFEGKPNEFVRLNRVQYGGQKCLVVSIRSAVWFLNPVSLEPMKFQGLPNPIDLNQEPYAEALAIPSEQGVLIDICNVEPSEGDGLEVHCWKDFGKWVSGIRLNPQTASLDVQLDLGKYATYDESTNYSRRLILDPLKKLKLFDTTAVQNLQTKKLDFYPKLVLNNAPWLVGSLEHKLVFLSRYDLEEQFVVPMIPSITIGSIPRSRPIAESTVDNSLILWGYPSKPWSEKVGDVVWKLPLSDVNVLPKRSVIATDLQFPTFSQPGQELRLPVKPTNPKVEVKLSEAPEGVALQENILKWTPAVKDIGVKNVELELSLGEEKMREKHRVVVTPTLLDVGISPTHIRVSDDGRYVAGISGEKLVLIDGFNSTILHRVELDDKAIFANFFGDTLLLFSAIGTFKALSVTNPTQQRTITYDGGEQNSFNYGYVLRDRHYLFLADHNFESFPLKRISLVKSLPDFNSSPLSKYVSPPTDAFGYFPGSSDVVFGGVVLDENDTVQNVLNLEWTGVYYANPIKYAAGIDGKHLDASQVTSFQDQGGNNANTASMRLTSKKSEEPGYKILEWYVGPTLLQPTPVASYFVPETYKIDDHPMTYKVQLGDKLYFFVKSYFATFALTNQKTAAESEPSTPLRIKPLNPLTVLPNATGEIEFEITGGTPPYNVDLIEEWGTYGDAIRDIESDHQKFYKLSVEGDRVILTLDGKTLMDRLGEKPGEWLSQSRFRIARNRDISQLAVETTHYREKVNESLRGLIKQKFTGVPLGLQLLLSVSDSDTQNALLPHCVIMDFSAAKYTKLCTENDLDR